MDWLHFEVAKTIFSWINNTECRRQEDKLTQPVSVASEKRNSGKKKKTAHYACEYAEINHIDGKQVIHSPSKHKRNV